MNLCVKRAAAGLLCLTAMIVGVWAAAAPYSFFSSFPLPGHAWVVALPAYNEHLTHDVGDLYLALMTISTWAVLRPRDETFRLVGAAWLVFSVLHIAFHLDHLRLYSAVDAVDAVGNVVALGTSVLLGGLLLLPGATGNETGRW